MKYFSKKVKLGSLTFDSRREASRYLFLKSEEKVGVIESLQTQKEFELLPKQTKMVEVRLKTKTKMVERVDEMAVKYHCDFWYHDLRTDTWVIEEVKSPMTAMVRDYPLRRKLVKLMVKRMNQEAGQDFYEFREVIG